MPYKLKWEAEPVEHLLKITHLGEEKEFYYSQRYVPEGHSTNISLHLSADALKVIIEPYSKEHLRRRINLKYPDRTIQDLFVGIQDETKIIYFGKYLIFKSSDTLSNNLHQIEQYFFKDDQPSEFYSGSISGPEWPPNRLPILTKKLFRYLDELKKVRPAVTISLEQCMEHLTRAGPTVKKQSLIYLRLHNLI